jgi:hypothetical protein
MKVRIRLLKKWGEFQVDDVGTFDERKASDLIAKKIAEKVGTVKEDAPVERAVSPVAQETAVTIEAASVADTEAPVAPGGFAEAKTAVRNPTRGRRRSDIVG